MADMGRRHAVAVIRWLREVADTAAHATMHEGHTTAAVLSTDSDDSASFKSFYSGSSGDSSYDSDEFMDTLRFDALQPRTSCHTARHSDLALVPSGVSRQAWATPEPERTRSESTISGRHDDSNTGDEALSSVAVTRFVLPKERARRFLSAVVFSSPGTRKLELGPLL